MAKKLMDVKKRGLNYSKIHQFHKMIEKKQKKIEKKQYREMTKEYCQPLTLECEKSFNAGQLAIENVNKWKKIQSFQNN